MSAELSPTMQACIVYMEANAGEIVRHPGGFWANDKWTRHNPYFGTKTVQALVDRGMAAYTLHQFSVKRGSFPIRASLTKKATA